MDDYQERVVEEKKELDIKLERLDKFIAKEPDRIYRFWAALSIGEQNE